MEEEKDKGKGRETRLLRGSYSIGYRNFRHRPGWELTGKQLY